MLTISQSQTEFLISAREIAGLDNFISTIIPIGTRALRRYRGAAHLIILSQIV